MDISSWTQTLRRTINPLYIPRSLEHKLFAVHGSRCLFLKKFWALAMTFFSSRSCQFVAAVCRLTGLTPAFYQSHGSDGSESRPRHRGKRPIMLNQIRGQYKGRLINPSKGIQNKSKKNQVVNLKRKHESLLERWHEGQDNLEQKEWKTQLMYTPGTGAIETQCVGDHKCGKLDRKTKHDTDTVKIKQDTQKLL